MAKNDITIADPGIASQVGTLKHRVDDRTTSSASGIINVGEPVKKSNSNFGLQMATGDPEIGTDVALGISSSISTETSSAEGTVEVYPALPGIVFRGKATTVGNIDTDAELVLFLLNSVTFDLTGAIYTIDEDETDDPNVHGLIIVDGDIRLGTLDFIFNYRASLGGAEV